MIVQPHNGQLLSIRQTDHAALAGLFAEHWDNADFARPSPRHPLIAAAVHHDDGWLLWEAVPRIDPTTRRPYQFTAMPIADHVGFYVVFRGSRARMKAFLPGCAERWRDR